MAPDHHDEEISPNPASDSSADETDSQDSDSMPRSADSAGVRRKSSAGQGKKANSDPHREKRKKAKRACRPCQVAHLTCGDERPCLRCVKRGCSHMCRDGVRKKAKYLADTPAETLTQELGTRGRTTVSNAQDFLARLPVQDLPGGLPGGIFPSSYGPLPSTDRTSQPLSGLSTQAQTFGTQPALFPTAYGLAGTQSQMPLQNYGPGLQQNPTLLDDSGTGDISPDLFHPFDSNYLDNLNFENRFAAAEFGMLGTMTSGMTKSNSSSDRTGPFQPGAGGEYSTPGTSVGSFAPSTTDTPRITTGSDPSSAVTWPRDALSMDSGRPISGGRIQRSVDGVSRHEAPPAFAIGSSAYPSPSSGSSPQGTIGSRDDAGRTKNTYTNTNQQHPSPTLQGGSTSRSKLTKAASASAPAPGTLTTDQILPPPARRPRNPSEIYNNVKQPYSYTAAFHTLTALIQSRFSPQKTAHIAKALAAIRPSFISCTMRLNRDDLIFMEKCLQRTLLGLEEVISSIGTPTIVCRRTGEVVAAGKEFSYLTGWSRDVLLGKQPNLNVNIGGTGSRSGGRDTPARGVPEQKPDAPVNVVSLLDDDSVCDFFDDYAHLAFGDSRGTAMTPCRVLKYRTAQDLDLKEAKSSASGGDKPCVQVLGQKEGKIDCMMCWTVKRDVFDIPMLFVMNVLPCM